MGRPSKFRCFEFEDNIYCPDARSPVPFTESQKIYQAMNQNRSDILIYEKEKGVNSIDCFSMNISSAWHFTFYFLIATIIIHIAHELFHFIFLFLSNEQVNGFSFNITGGTTFASSIDVNAHSCWWWFFAVIGPILFVNGMSVLLVLSMYSTDKSNMFLYEKIPSPTSRMTIVLKSIGYVSSIVILTNTILAPLSELILLYCGFDVQSDFLLLWRVSFQLDEAILWSNGAFIITDIALMRVVLLLSVAFTDYLAIRYIFTAGKRVY